MVESHAIVHEIWISQLAPFFGFAMFRWMGCLKRRRVTANHLNPDP